MVQLSKFLIGFFIIKFVLVSIDVDVNLERGGSFKPLNPDIAEKWALQAFLGCRAEVGVEL